MKVSKEKFSLQLVEVDHFDSSKYPHALISPEGDVYLVDYMGHNAMAHMILEELYPNERVPYNELAETYLLKKGWLRTCRPYFINEQEGWHYTVTTEPEALHLVTDAQLAVVGEYHPRALRDLMDDLETIEWRNRMRMMRSDT